MDNFTEELVVRKNTGKDYSKLAVYLLAIFAVPAIFILLGITVNFYFIIVAVCAFFFAIYGSYYLVTALYTEFEYSVTNSNITIDRVIAKRSRKMVISVDIKRLNTLKKLKDGGFADKPYKKIFKASITPDGDDVYASELHLDKFGGDCLLLFSPGEKTLEAMKPYLRSNIKAELFKTGTKKPSANRTSKTSNNNAREKTDEKPSLAQKTEKTQENKPDSANNGKTPDKNKKKSKKKN
ncbi:MAG: hypothetical protein II685_03225 [Clostridia bacterium]|nr:hypothetical protein [Clostridia bacterium]